MYGRVTKFFHDRGYGFILGKMEIHILSMYLNYMVSIWTEDIMYFLRRMPMTGAIITLRM